MALKAPLIDDEGTPHMLIGISGEDIEVLEAGQLYVLPTGHNVPLTDKSDVVVIFEETDEKLAERMKSHARNV